MSATSQKMEVKGTQAQYEVNTISSLTRLDLDQNSIGDQGTLALSEALKANSTSTTLNLRYNSIGDNGVQALHHEIVDAGGACNGDDLLLVHGLAVRDTVADVLADGHVKQHGLLSHQRHVLA
ncbi:hypothetical protein BGZ81_002292 [Podila clonocystis]|nr:hypothetical protein BGZ81_002292 [Podila clonocystis]